MKNIKILLLLVVTFFITGCSVQYDLIITDKKTVKEQAMIIDDNERILRNYDYIDLYLDNQIKTYKKLKPFRNYYFSKNVGDKKSYLQIEKVYKSLNDYANNSPFFNKMFENANIEKTNSSISFETSGDYFYDSVYGNTEQSEPDFYVGDINIRIRFHNKVIDSNADKVNEKNNTLEWLLTKEDKTKKIYFNISNEKRYDIIVVDFLKDNILNIFVVLILLLIVTAIGLYIYTRIKKNNTI